MFRLATRNLLQYFLFGITIDYSRKNAVLDRVQDDAAIRFGGRLLVQFWAFNVLRENNNNKKENVSLVYQVAKQKVQVIHSISKHFRQPLTRVVHHGAGRRRNVTRAVVVNATLVEARWQRSGTGR